MTEALGQGRVGLLNERRTHPALPLFILPSSHSFLRAQGLPPQRITARLRCVHQHRDVFRLWSQRSLSKGVNKQDMWLLKDHWSLHGVSIFSLWDHDCALWTVSFLLSQKYEAESQPRSQSTFKMWLKCGRTEQIASKQMQLSGNDLRDVSVGPWEFQSLHSYTAMKTKW